MRAVVQRVTSASVRARGASIGIGRGLLVLVGIHVDDDERVAEQLVRKVLALRLFDDADGRMNLSVQGVGGAVLCVSEFTLYGDTRRGTRPSYTAAAPANRAEPLYEYVRNGLGGKGGWFGQRMAVTLTNDGPVTLLVEA